MSFLTQYMVNQGVPQETIILILMLPIAATVIAFGRQIIGLRGFGIYTPLIIAFSFLATGLKYGLAIFVVILLVGTSARFLVRYIQLLYLPRMAIVLTAVALAILALFLEGAYSGRTGLISASIFAVLIMTTLVEKFVAVQIERGAKEAVVLTIETLILSVVCYWLAASVWLRNLVFVYPLWVIMGTVIINILLGKWTGLRLSEYWRFREVIKGVELPEQK